MLQRGTRKIPLISSKELNKTRFQLSEKVPNYLPLGLNQSGVMPVILTTAVLVIPNYLSQLGLIPQIIFPVFSQFTKFVYWIVYFGLILQFSSFYSTIILNPKDISDELKKMSVTIPGIRPGVETMFYISKIMKRITLLGSILLATLATLPNIVETLFNISSLNGLSTTSLLIVAGVVVDIVREIESIFFSTIYNEMYQ